MANFFNNTEISSNSVTKFLLRLISASVVLAITAFLTPGFTIAGLFPLVLSALVISVLDFAVGRTGVDATPIGRGLSGFALAAIIIYVTQFFVPGYSITILGSMVGALFYGVIATFIPGKAL